PPLSFLVLRSIFSHKALRHIAMIHIRCCWIILTELLAPTFEHTSTTAPHAEMRDLRQRQTSRLLRARLASVKALLFTYPPVHRLARRVTSNTPLANCFANLTVRSSAGYI